MGNGAVKTIVMLMVLVVLSVLIGAQISDSMKDSIGAFALIAFICVAFGMLWMGKKCWQLLYFLPAFLINAPLLGETAGVHNLPLEYAAAAVVFVYGLLMWVMGYIQLRWRAHLFLDLLIVCLVIMFIWSYLQYPVSIMVLDPDAEYVGGKEYVWMLTALLYYIALSSMSGPREETLRVIKLSFYVLCAGQLLYCVYGCVSIGSIGGLLNFRLSFFCTLASALLFYIYCSAPVSQVLRSSRNVVVGIFSMAALLLGGRRETFINAGEALIFASLLKKELTAFVVMGGLLYGMAFILGEQHVWDNAPSSVQRVLVVLPGVNLPGSVRHSTEGSSETRRMVWRLGLDPRTGYIKDYIWGDGFQTKMSEMRRGQIARMRGVQDKSAWGFARSLAASGNWHNGWLVVVHKLGIVGLVLVNSIFLCGMVMTAQVSRAYRRRAEYPFYMALCLPVAQTALSFAWGTQTFLHFFNIFQALGIIKILYCIAREEGTLRPLFYREPYVPMTIRELENAH